MKLLLSGFLPRDEMAFDLFLKRFMPTWRWHGQPAKADPVFHGADLLVLDLAAHGWSQCNQLTLEKLALATGNTVAVLLMPPHDTSWSATPAKHGNHWVRLSKPYNAEAMRAALSHAGELVKALQKRPAPVKLAVSPATRAHSAEVPVTTPIEPKRHLQSVAASVQAVVPVQSQLEPVVAVLPAVEHGINTDELARLLAQCPAERRLLLRKLLAGLQARVPFEVRFTMQHFLIVHPLDDWVASNTPLPVVQRVAGSDALAASVSMRVLALNLVEDRLHQLGAVPQDLGEFLLQLVTTSFPTARSISVP